MNISRRSATADNVTATRTIRRIISSNVTVNVDNEVATHRATVRRCATNSTVGGATILCEGTVTAIRCHRAIGAMINGTTALCTTVNYARRLRDAVPNTRALTVKDATLTFQQGLRIGVATSVVTVNIDRNWAARRGVLATRRNRVTRTEYMDRRVNHYKVVLHEGVMRAANVTIRVPLANLRRAFQRIFRPVFRHARLAQFATGRGPEGMLRVRPTDHKIMIYGKHVFVSP